MPPEPAELQAKRGRERVGGKGAQLAPYARGLRSPPSPHLFEPQPPREGLGGHVCRDSRGSLHTRL